MSISTLTYLPPVRKDLWAATLDYDLLEQADALYEAGDHLAATAMVLRHLFPAGEAPDLGRPFAFTQGSSRVTVRVDDGVCAVMVPMVRLPAGGGGVAALRYLLTKINGSGQLFQARLRGDDVALEFSEKLSALHPQKLVEVLRRMPPRADQHDDWMIGQFGVTPLERGAITPLDDDEAARAEAIWRTHWTEVEELVKEALRKRSGWFLNEVTAYAIHRLRFALPLGGTLLPRFLEASNVFNDGDADARKRETVLTKCIKDMKAVAADELRRQCGHVEYAISPHTEGTPQRYAGFFGPGNYLEQIEKFRAQGQSLDAAMSLVASTYYLLSTHTWPPSVTESLKLGLSTSLGKPWREIADQMLEHVKALNEAYGEDEEANDDDEDDDDAEDGAEEETA